MTPAIAQTCPQDALERDLRRFGGVLDYLPSATNNPFLLVLYMASGNWRNHQDCPVVLDLFCGAGGAAWGYWLAGYMVVGVDINPQPNYPFPFIQGDALEVVQRIGHLFDLVHASPPCQGYSRATIQWRKKGYEYPDLIEPVRDMLIKLSIPYVIENVEGAPLINPVRLTGIMFFLAVHRARLFEVSTYFLTPPPAHKVHARYYSVFGKGGGKRDGTIKEWSFAMDIWWMRIRELKESIPPTFTEYIGRQLYSTVTGIQEAA